MFNTTCRSFSIQSREQIAWQRLHGHEEKTGQNWQETIYPKLYILIIWKRNSLNSTAFSMLENGPIFVLGSSREKRAKENWPRENWALGVVYHVFSSARVTWPTIKLLVFGSVKEERGWRDIEVNVVIASRKQDCFWLGTSISFSDMSQSEIQVYWTIRLLDHTH